MEMFFTFTYNIQLSAPPERPSGRFDGKPQNRQQNHLKTRQKRAALFLRHTSIKSKNSAQRGKSPFSRGKSCFRRSSHPKIMNGDALLRGREALPAQPENRFSARQNRVRRRPAITLGGSRRTTQHTIHRRFDS